MRRFTLEEKLWSPKTLVNFDDRIGYEYIMGITVIELAEEVDLTIYTPACMPKRSDLMAFYEKKTSVYGEIIVFTILGGY